MNLASTSFPIASSFAFATVSHIVCEVGAAKRLGALTRQVAPQVSRVLLVTDRGLLSTLR